MSMTSASGTLGAISQISECSSEVKGESYVGIGVEVGAGVTVGTGTVAVGAGEGIRVGRDVVVAVGEGRSVETSGRGDGVRVDLRLGTEVEVGIASMVGVATRTWFGLGSIVAIEQATPRIVARVARPFPIFIR